MSDYGSILADFFDEESPGGSVLKAVSSGSKLLVKIGKIAQCLGPMFAVAGLLIDLLVPKEDEFGKITN